MTKNVLRLGLVLAVCGAMMSCKNGVESAEPQDPTGQPQELPGGEEAAEQEETGQPEELPGPATQAPD